jgi:DNA polymerase-3 subunit delta
MRCSWPEFERLEKPDLEASCFLLAGPEDYFKPKAIELLRERFAAGEELERERLDARSLEAESLVQRAQTAGLFAARRFLVVARAQEMKPAQQKLLAKSLSRLPSLTCLVLATSGEGRLEPALAAAVGKLGGVVDFPALDVGEAAAWVVQELKQAGKRIEPAAVRKLVERVGTSLLSLSLEVEKLALHAGEREVITSAEIEALVARTAAERVFALTDAVAERRTGEALALLGRLFEDREPPEHIAGLLHRQFRLLWQTKLLLERGWKPGEQVPEEMEELLPREGSALAAFADRGRGWLARKCARQAARLKWGQLEAALRALHAWDLSAKGIEGKVRDARFGLELLLLQVCRGLEIPAWRG